jgi:hypothetical protein
MNGQVKTREPSEYVQNAKVLTGIVKEKWCPKCQKTKNAAEFKRNKGHKDGLETSCRECLKEYNKAYRAANLEHLLENARKWKKDNHERHLYCSRKWRINNQERHGENVRCWAKNNPDKVKAAQKKFYKNNPDKIRAWTRKTSAKLRSTPSGKLKRNMSITMCLALKGRKAGRHWESLVGYNLNDLKGHLEKLFKPGMTWDNYGLGGWEVDHILPIASFNFENSEDIEKCWAFKNLQPLWSLENKSKGKKITS